MAGTRTKRKSTATPKNTRSNKKTKVSEDKNPEASSSDAVADLDEVLTVVEEKVPAVVVENAPAAVEENIPAAVEENALASSSAGPSTEVKADEEEEESILIGDPVPDAEARKKWPHRYLSRKNSVWTGTMGIPKGNEAPKEIIQARRHYTEALVDGRVHFKLGDDGFVYAGDNEESYICRIIELFEGVDGDPYFRAQWFYRAKDTIIGECSDLIDAKRIFFSEVKDDNSLGCLLEKLRIVRVPLYADVDTKRALLANGDFYYDMMYLVPFSSYQNLPTDNETDGDESESTISSECNSNASVTEVSQIKESKRSEMTLLDLYSGCGAMSTGLCLGANMAAVNLITKWAVDFNQHACESLKLNHPETEVRNEPAEDFLQLLKVWNSLCRRFSLIGGDDLQPSSNPVRVENDVADDDDAQEDDEDEEVFEVDEILSICYGDPKKIKLPGLYFKIRWKGYGPEEDTWEPEDGLGDCEEKLKQFVQKGFANKILPVPGGVDVICGGPPCQGISGFNRFRNKEKPLEDEKNKQLLVYMDIVEFLKPRFALMENVVDIVKFAKGYLGRYSLGRLVSMNYQARVGLMTAGMYGLPQFRMRMFMWAAGPGEKLPQYPLPTHKVVSRGSSPVEFESNAVTYDDLSAVVLEKELFLEDAISDLPPVTNFEEKDEIPYRELPKTEFQKFIRLKKQEMPGFSGTIGVDSADHLLYDHLPYKCNDDDYQRVCQIPKKKGANFRDLAGVRVKSDNHVEFDPNVERVLLASGKPLVPDYAMTFVDGRSSKPFGRLWWDEIVPTVVTRAEPHNQAILHPVQDRVLTVRENARLQGFPDYYKLVGPIKERYMQVGNAVAVPVARALGYSLAMSCKGIAGEGPVFTLPKKFPNLETAASVPLIEENQ
uniref:DNA (cytosine-5)-methyltransferase CMT3-like n=1 Tax=Erigeron canadensis TaxID=72917 RepID=UPI001CB8C384|nr:DNA (cytosine-5)-methyltransferase CMT3-like [Erigeron canadensis]